MIYRKIQNLIHIIKKLGKLLSLLSLLARLVIKALSRILKSKQPSHLLRFIKYVQETLYVFIDSIPINISAEKIPIASGIQQRNNLWKLADSAYHQSEWEFSNTLLYQADDIEDYYGKSLGFDPLDFRIIGSNLLESIGHTFAGLSMRATMMELGESPVRRYWVLDSQKQKQSHTDYWKKYFQVVRVSETARIVMEQSLWPLMESIQTVRTRSGSVEHRFVHNTFAKLRETKIKEPHLRLSEEDRTRGYEFLKTFGISDSDWFVAIHVRESRDPLYGRNANIQDYIKSIEFIIGLGGKVIRIGDKNMRPLDDMDGLIDLTRLEEGFDWLDLFVIAESRFFICTTSGPQFVGYSFGTPMLWTNAPDIGKALYFPNTLLLPKLIMNQSGRILTLRQMLESPYGWSDSRIDSIRGVSGEIQNMRWKDNEPDDILSGVKEVISMGFENTSASQREWMHEMDKLKNSGYTKVSATFLERWSTHLFDH